jgi:hypothetical protein
VSYVDARGVHTRARLRRCVLDDCTYAESHHLVPMARTPRHTPIVLEDATFMHEEFDFYAPLVKRAQRFPLRHDSAHNGIITEPHAPARENIDVCLGVHEHAHHGVTVF